MTLAGWLSGLLVLVLVLLQCFCAISEEWETGQVSAWRMTVFCFVTKLRGLAKLLLKICTRCYWWCVRTHRGLIKEWDIDCEELRGRKDMVALSYYFASNCMILLLRKSWQCANLFLQQSAVLFPPSFFHTNSSFFIQDFFL